MLFAALFLFTGLLAAEDFFKVKQQIVDSALFRFLGFYMRPTFFLRNLGYTSNIYSYALVQTPDWIAEPGVDLSASLVLRNRMIFTAFFQPTYSFYLDHKEARAWNGRWGVDAFTWLGPINLKFSLFRASQRSLPSPEFGMRIRNTENGGYLSLDYGRQDSLFFNLSAERRDMRYANERYFGDIDPSLTLDHREERFRLSINKVIFTRTILFFAGNYEQYRFVHSPDRDSDSRSYVAGIRFPEIGRLTGSLSIGWRELLPKNPRYAYAHNMMGQGDVGLRLLQKIKLKGEYLIDRFYSMFGDNIYFDQRRFGAGTDIYLTRSLKAGYLFQLHWLNYHTFDSDSRIREDRFRQQTVSLGFRVSGRWTLGISYIIYSGDSTDQMFRRKYYFIGGSISNEF